MSLPKRITKSLVTLFLVITMLCACFVAPSDDTFMYMGPHADCYTVVLHTVLGTNSGNSAQITLLETDQYGRTMFTFVGLSSVAAGKKSVQGVFVHYGTEGNQVRYWEDGEYLLWEVPLKSPCTPESVLEHCTETEVKALKQAHDWNYPPTETLTYREIVRKAEAPHKRSVREKYFAQYSEHYAAFNDTFLDEDATGKAIYFLREFDRDAQNGEEDGSGYLMLILADGTLASVEKVRDLLNCREQLIAFKAANGWEPIIAIVPSA